MAEIPLMRRLTSINISQHAHPWPWQTLQSFPYRRCLPRFQQRPPSLVVIKALIFFNLPSTCRVFYNCTAPRRLVLTLSTNYPHVVCNGSSLRPRLRSAAVFPNFLPTRPVFCLFCNAFVLNLVCLVLGRAYTYGFFKI